ncbi:hypothetical protein HPB51_004651 [Rhipicephalus microplus]|uniref:Uncharacterized protein n=1 Tax=Rhipicephalus microplus TaxID=6941 RepID=A0A9J6EFB3_RHIMP|nr:hypothetical protein HPB51_004651 [Rhipicephalus microplus]
MPAVRVEVGEGPIDAGRRSESPPPSSALSFPSAAFDGSPLGLPRSRRGPPSSQFVSRRRLVQLPRCARRPRAATAGVVDSVHACLCDDALEEARCILCVCASCQTDVVGACGAAERERALGISPLGDGAYGCVSPPRPRVFVARDKTRSSGCHANQVTDGASALSEKTAWVAVVTTSDETAGSARVTPWVLTARASRGGPRSPCSV